MPKLSLVIPAYNEEARIVPFLASIAIYMKTNQDAIHEVFVVDDGSTDATAQVAKDAGKDIVGFRLIKHEKNKGKGAAVQTGVMAANGDYIVFMDADGATDIQELPKMIAALESSDVAVGNRWMKGAKTERHSLLRALSGFVYRNYMALFGLGKIDTMCGFKGYKKEVAQDLYKNLQEERWLFDTEIAYKTVLRKYIITNFPINWESKDGSKLDTKTLFISAVKILPLVLTIKRQEKLQKRSRMKIVFVTTQSFMQSTLIGRVLPLAQEFQKMGNKIVLLIHRENSPASSTLGVLPLTPSVFPARFGIHTIGVNPFERTSNGKKRKNGLRLIWTMKINALRAAWCLIREKPDVVIIVKPLPENTLAVLLAKPFLRNTNIILDVDDFELEANELTSLVQRAAIHWSERVAVQLASHIIIATPFLGDHMKLLAGNKKPVTLIVTGLPSPATLISSTLGVSALTPSVFPMSVATTDRANHNILFIGSISHSSGHRVDMLPEILFYIRKSIPDATLTIAGSGDDEENLRKKFQDITLADAVTWTGRFTMDDVPRLLQNTVVLIDPIDTSIANRAKSSFRVALALEYGIPIITSSIGIRTDMIPVQLHEKFFARPENIKDYAEKITNIFTSPLTQEESGSMKKKSEEYRWDNLAKVYYDCLV